MYINDSLVEFNDKLASAEPTPGGGGASALIASLGVGLGIMVGSLTVGRKKYADVEEQIIELIESAKILQTKLLALVDEDAKAFEPLSKAYSLPKDEPNRDAIMEDCLNLAASVPLQIVNLSCEAICIVEKFSKLGSKMAISDAGCGASACRSALESAALNVFINTKLMKDRTVAESINSEVKEKLEKYIPIAESIYNEVYGCML